MVAEIEPVDLRIPESSLTLDFGFAESEPEPEPFVPGETLDVWPVRVDNGAQGFIVARRTPYAEPMSANFPEYPIAEDESTPDYRAGFADGREAGSETEPDARTWILDDGTETPIGPVERALREDVSRLKTTAHFGTTLLASATALAQAMDRAQPDKIASIGREFREHLKRIEELSGDDDSTVQHRSSLSTPV